MTWLETDENDRMTRWACPHCDESILAIATAASHACPSFRNRWVRWVRQDEEAT